MKTPPIDKFEEYRPMSRIWECESCKFVIKRAPDIEVIDSGCPICCGKFVPTSKIERAINDPNTEYAWILFLKTRKGEGREQFIQVQSLILEKENDYDDGWVPVSVIEEHVKSICSMDRSRLDCLLSDMLEYRIVTKKTEKVPSASTPNQNRTFYRYNSIASMRTLTNEGIKKEYSRLFKENIDLNFKLVDALSVLARHDLLQEYRLEQEESGKTGREEK
jgi:hypothetical protein